MADINEEFSQACQLIFGAKPCSLQKAGEWLGMRIPTVLKAKSSVSLKQLLIPNYSVFPHLPKNKLAGLEHFPKAETQHISADKLGSISSISNELKEKITYISEFVQGENLGVEGSIIYLNISNAYKIIDTFNSKHIAFTFFCDNSDHLFGCYKTFDSKFSIHCYNSRNLNLCFECDACRNCSNSMFCHNCENVHDSLFCSNAKNLRYAVANVVVGRDKFLEMRKMLVDHISAELMGKGKLDFDIFNFCERKAKLRN